MKPEGSCVKPQLSLKQKCKKENIRKKAKKKSKKKNEAKKSNIPIESEGRAIKVGNNLTRTLMNPC